MILVDDWVYVEEKVLKTPFHCNRRFSETFFEILTLEKPLYKKTKISYLKNFNFTEIKKSAFNSLLYFCHNCFQSPKI